MTYYHPTSKHVVDSILDEGFLSLRSLAERIPQLESSWFNRLRHDDPARTMVFDSPERAAEWWAMAHGTEMEILQIDGDVTVEQNSLDLPEGMLFLEGEISASQVSRYTQPQFTV